LWECDDVVTEELNQRLTYALGSDVSGWDLTQVLRVPGTLNYKYTPAPRVRLLWNDGPTYRVAELERDLPKRERKSATRGARVAVSGWRGLTGKELARKYGVKPDCFARHWHRRFIVIHAVWGPMTERGASLEQIMWALEDCPAWHSKIEEHGASWRKREIERIEDAIERGA
jgi:hypothetical protein